jgi:hypothetical protein
MLFQAVMKFLSRLVEFKISVNVGLVHCKTGEAVFYNRLRFTACYLGLPQLGFLDEAILYHEILRAFIALRALLSWKSGAKCPLCLTLSAALSIISV